MAKSFGKYLALFLALCTGLCVSAGAVSAEQIQVSLPSVTVYVHAEDADLSQLSADQITATLGGKTLRMESFRPSDQGIFYLFMLDISRSIPESHFQAAKQAIKKTCTALRPQDRLALISFGNSVTVLSAGDEPVSDTLARLDTLSPTDNRTKFYDAMDTLVKTASKMPDLRRIAVVVSDGIDDTDAGMTQKEMEHVLQQSGIAVYALCTDAAAEADADKFNSFIRLSGGELYSFDPDNVQWVLDQLIQKLGNVWMLQLLLNDALTPASSVPLHVGFGNLGEIDAQLEPDYWLPDASAPYVTGVAPDPAALSVTVSFSEPVKNADSLSCYQLTDSQGLAVEITDAAYTSSARREVRLTVPSLQSAETYVLHVSGPVDLSDNQNALIPDQYSINAETAAPNGPNLQSVSEDTPSSIGVELRNLLLGAAAVLLAVTVGVILIVANARQSKSGAPGSRLSNTSSAPVPSGTPRRKKKTKSSAAKTRFFFKEH